MEKSHIAMKGKGTQNHT